jgi:hypothetical protein
MESQALPTTANTSYRMSWTAYIRPTLIFLIVMLFAVGAPATIGPIGWLVPPVVIGVYAVRIMTLRSVVLFLDEEGVWVFSGIFPWSKGTSGVKWRDLEDAVYFPNFFSWMLKSYTVRIGHRFTKSSEIVLKHMALGHNAAMNINEYHSSLLANGRLV